MMYPILIFYGQKKHLIYFISLVAYHQGSPEKGPIVCVCVYAHLCEIRHLV